MGSRGAAYAERGSGNRNIALKRRRGRMWEPFTNGSHILPRLSAYKRSTLLAIQTGRLRVCDRGGWPLRS
jgi:hypothetical protein